eukprot:TRINITY_DN1478_c0_g3_i1.p1 TRINITY_DN1478_c0_g3~~TRINITY_DN1478_c0_g3_i1.p1  ORF type:complete len:962 (+),score=206.18 TRINITY_DN1478_c0_g3_i1:51-2888(+)
MWSQGGDDQNNQQMQSAAAVVAALQQQAYAAALPHLQQLQQQAFLSSVQAVATSDHRARAAQKVRRPAVAGHSVQLPEKVVVPIANADNVVPSAQPTARVAVLTVLDGRHHGQEVLRTLFSSHKIPVLVFEVLQKTASDSQWVGEGFAVQYLDSTAAAAATALLTNLGFTTQYVEPLGYSGRHALTFVDHGNGQQGNSQQGSSQAFGSGLTHAALETLLAALSGDAVSCFSSDEGVFHAVFANADDAAALFFLHMRRPRDCPQPLQQLLSEYFGIASFYSRCSLDTDDSTPNVSIPQAFLPAPAALPAQGARGHSAAQRALQASQRKSYVRIVARVAAACVLAVTEVDPTYHLRAEPEPQPSGPAQPESTLQETHSAQPTAGRDEEEELELLAPRVPTAPATPTTPATPAAGSAFPRAEQPSVSATPSQSPVPGPGDCLPPALSSALAALAGGRTIGAKLATLAEDSTAAALLTLPDVAPRPAAEAYTQLTTHVHPHLDKVLLDPATVYVAEIVLSQELRSPTPTLPGQEPMLACLLRLMRESFLRMTSSAAFRRLVVSVTRQVKPTDRRFVFDGLFARPEVFGVHLTSPVCCELMAAVVGCFELPLDRSHISSVATSELEAMCAPENRHCLPLLTEMLRLDLVPAVGVARLLAPGVAEVAVTRAGAELLSLVIRSGDWVATDFFHEHLCRSHVIDSLCASRHGGQLVEDFVSLQATRRPVQLGQAIRATWWLEQQPCLQQLLCRPPADSEKLQPEADDESSSESCAEDPFQLPFPELPQDWAHHVSFAYGCFFFVDLGAERRGARDCIQFQHPSTWRVYRASLRQVVASKYLRDREVYKLTEMGGFTIDEFRAWCNDPRVRSKHIENTVRQFLQLPSEAVLDRLLRCRVLPGLHSLNPSRLHNDRDRANRPPPVRRRGGSPPPRRRRRRSSSDSPPRRRPRQIH